MNCDACRLAAERLWGEFFWTCPGCKARALSRSPEHHASRKAGKQSPEYRDALKTLGLAHEDVRRARELDAINRGDE